MNNEIKHLPNGDFEVLPLPERKPDYSNLNAWKRVARGIKVGQELFVTIGRAGTGKSLVKK